MTKNSHSLVVAIIIDYKIRLPGWPTLLYFRRHCARAIRTRNLRCSYFVDGLTAARSAGKYDLQANRFLRGGRIEVGSLRDRRALLTGVCVCSGFAIRNEIFLLLIVILR